MNDKDKVRRGMQNRGEAAQMRDRDSGLCGVAIARPGISVDVLPVSLDFSPFMRMGWLADMPRMPQAGLRQALCQLSPAHERLAKHSGGESGMIM
jgi:hypothetical protein